MNFDKKFILVIPALITFIIALIPTLKYGWPLSNDIFFHVHMAKLYLEQGIIFWDPLTLSPYGGPIYYPPLFQFLLASIPGIDIFQFARFLQPLFAAGLVFSFSYVAYKLYGLFVGFIAAFLLMFSAFFHKFMLPIPETMALILFPLVIYLYYISFKENNYKYSIFAGVLAGLIFLTHRLSSACLILVLISFTVSIMILKRKSIFKHFLTVLGISLLMGSVWWLFLLSGQGYGFSGFESYNINLWEYPAIFGWISIILAFCGGFLMLKKRSDRDILILSWIIPLLILAEVYLLDINILSNRVLTFVTFPLVIMAGLGFKWILSNFNGRYTYIAVSIVIIAAVYSGFSVVDNFNYTPSWLRTSDAQIDVGEWFKINGDHNKSVVAAPELNMIIVAISRQPVTSGGYVGVPTKLNKEEYPKSNYTRDDILKYNIGYFVFDVNENPPSFSKVVYENSDYKIAKVQI